MKNKRGFTLVELLAVIVILGVLLMIAVPAVQNVIKKTKNNATQKQAELFIDAAKKMAIIDEPTNDKVIYKLIDLDSDVDTDRFTGMVVASKENGSYKYYIYLNDSVNKKTIGNNDNDIFKFASEDKINENVTDGGKDFKEELAQIIKVNNNTYSYSGNTLNPYHSYSVKENVTVTVGDNTYTGIVIKSGTTIRVLLTQQKTIMSYTSIKSNKSIVGTTIPTLEDIKILGGNNNISNNFCDGKYTAQADCSTGGFKSGYNAGVAIWLSCGNSDSCPCKENGDTTPGTAYCPRLAVNGSIHTRGLASSGIYFMPVIEAEPSQVKSSS